MIPLILGGMALFFVFLLFVVTQLVIHVMTKDFVVPQNGAGRNRRHRGLAAAVAPDQTVRRAVSPPTPRMNLERHL